MLFHTAKLRNGADPDVFITYNEGLRNQMEECSSKMSDSQFIHYVLNSIGKAYSTTVEHILWRMEENETDMTLELFRSQLSARFERMNTI